MFPPYATVTHFEGRQHVSAWMARFMVIGRRVGSLLRLPALHLAAESAACIQCGKCTRECPMSLSVQDMVLRDNMVDDECVLCDSCVDTCPRQVIQYQFGRTVAPQGRFESPQPDMQVVK